MKNEEALKYGEILSKCWEDEEFKKGFIADPEAVLKEYGIKTEEGVEYKVVEAPKLVEYLVLPEKGVKAAVQDVAKILLQAAEKSEEVIPAGAEVRIIQNTEDTRYLVLPASPKTLTAAELECISGSGKTVNYTEVVSQMVEAQTAVTSTTHSVEVEVAAVVVVGAVLF